MSKAGQRDFTFKNVQALRPKKRLNNGLFPAQDASADDVTGFPGGAP
jgi:hypothetical protein